MSGGNLKIMLCHKSALRYPVSVKQTDGEIDWDATYRIQTKQMKTI